MGYASLAFAPPEGWHAGAELRYMSDIQANDANSAQAPLTVAGVNAGYRFTWNRWALDVFSRVDNVFDRRYVGSVIVNEGNGRYFEPAPVATGGGAPCLTALNKAKHLKVKRRNRFYVTLAASR